MLLLNIRNKFTVGFCSFHFIHLHICIYSPRFTVALLLHFVYTYIIKSTSLPLLFSFLISFTIITIIYKVNICTHLFYSSSFFTHTKLQITFKYILQNLWGYNFKNLFQDVKYYKVGVMHVCVSVCIWMYKIKQRLYILFH